MERRSGSGFTRRSTPRLVLCALLSIAMASSARAGGGTKGSVLLDSDEVPPGCRPVDGIFPTDLQTQILYEYSAYEGFLPAPKSKGGQSLECEGKKGTLFWFAYANEEERRRVSAFARGVLWGEGHPTPMHPELVLEGGAVLVVVSFRQAPAALVAALERKLSAGSRAGATEK